MVSHAGSSMLLVQTALLFTGCTAGCLSNKQDRKWILFISIVHFRWKLDDMIWIQMTKDSLTLQVQGVTGQVSILSKERLNSWMNMRFLCRDILRTMLITALNYDLATVWTVWTKHHTKQINILTLDTLRPWHKKNKEKLDIKTWGGLKVTKLNK